MKKLVVPAAAAALLVLPAFLPSDYYVNIASQILIAAIFASSLNLLVGYGGLISIAHPVFYAIGAYASALLARDLAVPVIVAMPAGALAALAASLLVALPSLRVSGDYLLIASIGFQLGVLEIIKNVAGSETKE